MHFSVTVVITAVKREDAEFAADLIAATVSGVAMALAETEVAVLDDLREVVLTKRAMRNEFYNPQQGLNRDGGA